MKVRKELIRETARLVNSGHLDEARVLAGHIRLLQEIFKIPYANVSGHRKKSLEPTDREKSLVLLKKLNKDT